MKKVVQSRWNGCSLSASQVSAFGQFSNRCRVALDRGAFSDLEVSTVLHESDEQERTELRHQKKQNDDTEILGHKSTFVDGESIDYHQALSGTSSRYPRRVRARQNDVKPKKKYSELIADVFECERKAQMKKADIVASIKSRYVMVMLSSCRRLKNSNGTFYEITCHQIMTPFMRTRLHEVAW